jgi:phage terminase small subunit
MTNGRPQGSRNAMLTPKQAKFVREYLIDLNATRAAIRAGYSKQTAHSHTRVYL